MRSNLFKTLELISQQISRVYERKISGIKLRKLAHYDEVTGLPNRVYFQDLFERVIRKAKRKKTSFALLYLDFDDFKKINDAYGYLVGDKLLRITAEDIQLRVRGIDTLVRFSGDEFIILTEEIEAPDEVGLIAKRILSMFSQKIEIENYQIEISMSIGIAVYPFAGEDKETLVKSTDIAMYRAKELGKYQDQFFTDVLNEKNARSKAIEEGIKEALLKQEIYLVYQLQINLEINCVSGFEVLIRWQSAELCHVSPF